MDVKELRKLDEKELSKKLLDKRKEYANMFYEKRLGKVSNTSKLKVARKEISRILTVLSEKEIMKNG